MVQSVPHTAIGVLLGITSGHAPEERREALLGRASRMLLVRARWVFHTQHLVIIHDQEAAGMDRGAVLFV